ncbi:acyl-CoA synthetase family member 2, mitochondrial [Trichonephila clavipes]|nr:acyl-CoA synthetase family member 2, mitochondrial [Trichonephila clavipes]
MVKTDSSDHSRSFGLFSEFLRRAVREKIDVHTEVSGSAFIPLSPLGRQEGEREREISGALLTPPLLTATPTGGHLSFDIFSIHRSPLHGGSSENYHTHLQEEYANCRKPPDGADSGRIIGRLECGRTQLEVSEELGIAQSVISRLWQRFQVDSNVSRCYSTGRPRVTTTNEDQYLAVTAKRNRRSTASDLSRQLSSATGTTVSRQIMYRRLGHIGL